MLGAVVVGIALGLVVFTAGELAWQMMAPWP